MSAVSFLLRTAVSIIVIVIVVDLDAFHCRNHEQGLRERKLIDDD